MKKTTTFTILLLLMAAVSISMTSCLNDDDDNKSKGFSPAEKAAMMAEMAGQYTGNIYFINDSARVDSVAVNADLTAVDSTFTIHNFPFRILSAGMGESMEDYRKVLEMAGIGTFKDVLQLYPNTFDQPNLYTFWALPMTKDQLHTKFTYENVEHEITVNYASQVNDLTTMAIYYPIGEFYKKEIIVYILISEVNIDGYARRMDRIFYYYGKKF